MAVKDAAKLLDVGRPALSNLLNGNADLSPEMARLEKAFSADPLKLLKMQAEFDQHRQRSMASRLPVGAYIPPFLKITAKDIENWVHGNIGARSLLPVFLRKLVNSTGQDLTGVDFPGYDQAERKGWDGRVDAGGATPWIPIGQSGWLCQEGAKASCCTQDEGRSFGAALWEEASNCRKLLRSIDAVVNVPVKRRGF